MPRFRVEKERASKIQMCLVIFAAVEKLCAAIIVMLCGGLLLIHLMLGVVVFIIVDTEVDYFFVAIAKVNDGIDVLVEHHAVVANHIPARRNSDFIVICLLYTSDAADE